MAFAENLGFGDDLHPIDMAEMLATDQHWAFDRLTDDRIALVVEGLWRSYAITLSWAENDEVLRLLCTFEMDPPLDRLAVLHDVMNRANDQVWTGAFTYWAEQKLMVWRFGLPLMGGQIAAPEQLHHMIAGAVTGCERFYPAFQLACWTDKTAAEAMQVAIAEAYGRA